MIPQSLALSEIQTAFRDVYQKLQPLISGETDFRGRRLSGVGISVDRFDAVTRFELERTVAELKALLTATETITRNTLLSTVKSTRSGPFITRGSPVAHAQELFQANDMGGVSWVSTGTQWLYSGGIFTDGIASLPGTLLAADAGFRFHATDTTGRYRWTGTTWIEDYELTDAVTAGSTNLLTLIHKTTGASSAGFGADIRVQLENSTGTVEDASADITAFSDPAAATLTTLRSIYTRLGGAALAEALAIGNEYISAAGYLIFKSQGANLGVLQHSNTGTRLWQMPNADGDMVFKTVTALTASRILLGDGTAKAKILGSLGTTTTVLHGNAAGDPTFGAVDLTADVTGVLPVANGGTNANTAAGARTSLDVAQRQTVGGDGAGTYTVFGPTTNGSITITSEGTISSFTAPT